jgi:hypothetical protein
MKINHTVRIAVRLEALKEIESSEGHTNETPKLCLKHARRYLK